jgi:uncharacterized protein YeaO (DUF488 family)
MMVKRIAAGSLRLKRAYDKPSRDDGTRILVDRLWPRGLTREEVAVDEWLKDLGPSTPLRKWFGHDPARWSEFRQRYAQELHANAGQVERLRAMARKGPVTLVYSARDEAHNDAVVLRDVILGVEPA